jgi:hypothetical protein
MDQQTQVELEAATFRRLLEHLDALRLDAVDVIEKAAIKTPACQRQRHDHNNRRGREHRDKQLVPD